VFTFEEIDLLEGSLSARVHRCRSALGSIVGSSRSVLTDYVIGDSLGVMKLDHHLKRVRQYDYCHILSSILLVGTAHFSWLMYSSVYGCLA
jgi:hypothetical protein